MAEKKPKRKLHLALGGGGARGLAHIGVLKVMEKENLPIEKISGTSGGAVIAAMYAQTGSTQKVYDKMQQFIHSDAFKDFGLTLFKEEKNPRSSYWENVENFIGYLKTRLAFTKVLIAESIFSSQRFMELISQLFDDGNIEQCHLPLQITAVNVDTGEDILIERGNLIKAVAASSAIPGLITPVEFNGMRLIDGAVLNAVPIICANRDREVLVGVDVSRCLQSNYPKKLALDYIFRAEEITTFRLNQTHLQKAEILIRPSEVRHRHWADFSHLDEFVASGEKATNEKLAQLKHAMTVRDSRLKIWLRNKICSQY